MGFDIGNLASGVASSVLGSAGGQIVNNVFGKSATSLGNDQRAYMDAAYGDLNQWEQAGAGQQGAASNNAGIASAQRIATSQNGTQIRMNNDKLDQAQPLVNEQVGKEAAQTEAAYSQTALNNASAQNTVMDTKLKQAQIGQVMQDTKNKTGNTSWIGGMGKDIGHYTGKAVDGIKSLYNNMTPKQPKKRMSIPVNKPNIYKQRKDVIQKRRNEFTERYKVKPN